MDRTRPEPARRALFTDARGAGMRVTWHAEHHLVVLSLWHGEVCAATFRMPPAEAARLAGFIVEHLGREAARNVEEDQGAMRSKNVRTEDS
jgi:hypothetical protein